MTRLINHVRSNAIAYVALFFALGGGGAGAAIAATAMSSSTIHACVSKATGALYVAKRCTSSQRALSFNQRGPVGPAGATATQPYGEVDPLGDVVIQKGMTITKTATGQYTVTITAAACKKSTVQIPTFTAIGTGSGDPSYPPPPGGSPQPDIAEDGTDGPLTIKVEAGYLQNGTFVNTPQGFYIVDLCGTLS